MHDLGACHAEPRYISLFENSAEQDLRPVKQKDFSVKLWLFSYPSVETCVLGAQKNRLTGTVLLSTHNICFG